MTTSNLLLNSQQANRVSSTSVAERNRVVVTASDNPSTMSAMDGAASGDGGGLVVAEEECQGLRDGVASCWVEHVEAANCEMLTQYS